MAPSQYQGRGMNDVSIAAMPQVSPVGFTGRPGFIRLLLKNVLLTLVTIGIYRFWARTATRRYLWNNVTIAGEPLEYTGRGIELFIGFLIAVAILFPLSFVYATLQQVLLADPRALGALFGIYILAIVVLTQIAIYRARRYRLTRTRWRGIGFGQDGSTGRYVAIALGWSVAWLLTLGLAEPWAQMALRRYELNHTVFGNRRFTFVGQGSGLIWRWLVVYVAFVVPLVSFALLNVDVWTELPEVIAVPKERRAAELKALFGWISGWWMLLLGVPAGILASLWYSVRQFRYIVAATNLGEVRFRSAAKTRAFVLNFLGLVGSMFVYLLIVVTIAFGIVMWIVGYQKLTGEVSLPMPRDTAAQYGFIAMFVVWLALYIGYYILSGVWLTYRIARHVCQTLTIENLAAVETVLQAPQRELRFGEGLADAFDVGAV
jgi:uncharacterized membrane protein YjgN (DUF898 family)